MLIDARHRRWMAGSVLLGAVATAGYVPYRREAVDGLTGSTGPGLAFGVAAAGLILFETALNLRKRVPTWRVSAAEIWLRGHIWLGLLTVPLVLFHSGFRFHGTLAALLTVVFFVVVASGLFGLALQQFLPRLMTRWAPGETVYEQIPHVVKLLRVEAYEIAAGVCGPIPEAADPAEGSGPLRRFYLEMVRPFLQGNGQTGPLADPGEAERTVEGFCRLLPPALHEAARDLAEVAAERRDVAIQRRLHHWLHGWLFVHVPLTTALLVLLVAHALLALRYSF